MPYDITVLINILATEVMKERIKKSLSEIIGVKDVYDAKIDDTNLSAFAKWNEPEISAHIEEIKHIPGVKNARAKILTPLQ